MTAAADLAALRPERGWRLAAWSIALLVVLLVLWARYAQLDEVAVAEGKVVPAEKVKLVQHLEGGILQAILVREGQRVAAGDPLAQIELPVSALNRDDLLAKRDGLVLARTRLLAEHAHGELALPAAEAQRRPELAAAERQTYEARRSELETRLAAVRQLVEQKRLGVDELVSAQAALRNDLRLARESFEISEKLARDGLTSKLEHLERRREVQRLEGQLQTLTASVPKAQAALAEAQQKLQEERQRYERELVERLALVEQDLSRGEQQLSQASGQAERTTIRSPIDGVVKNLRYHTIGGVVGPADAVMEIVPGDDDVVIEAQLLPKDRGYVAVGQHARVKISAYDFVRYGALDGEIVHVAADTTLDGEGHPYFKVLVRPTRGYLGHEAGQLPVTAGMVASVDIHTGTRSVMDYLLKPLLRVGAEAFRER